MTKKELEVIKKIVKKEGSTICLCGHFEFCHSCDGTESAQLDRICKALDEEFKDDISIKPKKIKTKTVKNEKHTALLRKI